ncbi:hypothetical protein NECAME_02253 [Necator americanus]|uniref:Uncharacterized protein n=1 Tax=Necator americanus TaxID=51031 RepID=W2TGZ2_NECAM|nr:hypothetical protein NECAME_02253 [Necator americanus]ETN80854.1 hypothetical protein NECAME_02253 [Necator americanus]
MSEKSDRMLKKHRKPVSLKNRLETKKRQKKSEPIDIASISIGFKRRRKPLLDGRNQALITVKDTREMQKCEGAKFKQRVKAPGCLTKVIVNRNRLMGRENE